jgi:hypothetical protein
MNKVLPEPAFGAALALVFPARTLARSGASIRARYCPRATGRAERSSAICWANARAPPWRRDVGPVDEATCSNQSRRFLQSCGARRRLNVCIGFRSLDKRGTLRLLGAAAITGERAVGGAGDDVAFGGEYGGAGRVGVGGQAAHFAGGQVEQLVGGDDPATFGRE